MIALLSWQQQFSKLKVQIFGSFASAWENATLRKTFFNSTNIVLYIQHIILQQAFPLFQNV